MLKRKAISEFNLSKYDIKHLNFSILDQGLVSGSNFITTILLVKLLGLNDFGIFSVFWLALLLINSIHSAIIVQPFLSISGKKENLELYFGSIILKQFIFSFSSFIIGILIFFIYSDFSGLNYNTSTPFLFGSVVAFYHFQDIFRRFFYILKKPKDLFLIDFASYGLRVVILSTLSFYSFNISLTYVFAIISICYLIGGIIGFKKVKYLFDKEQFKKDSYDHWKISKWLVLSNLMQWSSINFFLIVASIELGPISVGAIKIGQNVMMAFNVLLQSLENIIPSEASRIFSTHGLKELKSFLTKLTTATIVVAVAFGILISIFAKQLISILYSNLYLEYDFVIYYYSIILILMILLSVLRIYLITINLTKIWFKAYLITSCFSVIVSYPIITTYNIQGVLFGIVGAHLVLIISSILLIHQSNENTKI